MPTCAEAELRAACAVADVGAIGAVSAYVGTIEPKSMSISTASVELSDATDWNARALPGTDCVADGGVQAGPGPCPAGADGGVHAGPGDPCGDGVAASFGNTRHHGYAHSSTSG